MPKTRPPYSAEFRDRIVQLHKEGRSISSLAREFELTQTTIRSWIVAAREQLEPHTPLDDSERSELARLRRENARLKMERDILEKATAWFAQKTVPRSPSDS